MKFSIIIPCYNVEDYIEKTIKSLMLQTYCNYEVILIDDGSKDNTKYKIFQTIKNDNRFHYYYQKNLGVSFARNRGIEISRGEYIYFLDGDDIIEIDLLDKAEKILEDDHVDMFSFGYKIYEENNIRFFSNKKYNNKILNSREFLKKYLLDEINQNMCSFIIKKKKIEKIKFNEDLVMCEDIDFQLRLLLSGQFNIFYSSETYFCYLIRKNSTTKSNKIQMEILNTLDSMDKLRNEMLKNDIYEFKEYQIVRFFSEMSFFSDKKMTSDQISMVKENFKKYNYILKDLKISFNKKKIMLFILKMSYKLNIKFCFILFNLRKKFRIKFNKSN